MPVGEDEVVALLRHAESGEWATVRRLAGALFARGDAAAGALSRARLLDARARLELEGNSAEVRGLARDALRASPGDAELRLLLAKMEAASGDYAGARSTVAAGPGGPTGDLLRLARLVGVMPAAATETQPSLFYSYRYSLMSEDEVERAGEVLLRETWSADARVDQAGPVVDCHRAWNAGNADFARRNYRPAVEHYLRAVATAKDYFVLRYGTANPALLLRAGARWDAGGVQREAPAGLVSSLRRRNLATSLDELHALDWISPRGSASSSFAPYSGAQALVVALSTLPQEAENKIDGPLAVIAFALGPLAIAEAALARRRVDDSDELPGLGSGAGAEAAVAGVLALHRQARLLSEVIERPFALGLKGRILLLRGDGQFKARDADEAPQVDSNGAVLYQGLRAARAYQGVLALLSDETYGGVAQRVGAATSDLRSQMGALSQLVHDRDLEALRPLLGVNLPRAATEIERHALAQLGTDPGIAAVSVKGGVAEPPKRAPFEAVLDFDTTDPSHLREANPVLFALAAQAQLRLTQLQAGLNWLGYPDDYVPPWRFTFLLERARYLCEHAAKAQNTFLTFLANGEREEMQEASAAQGVALRRAGVDVEARRLEQARLELKASQAAKLLAEVSAAHAQQQFDAYRRFDEWVDSREWMSYLSTGLSVAGSFALAVAAPGPGTVMGAAALTQGAGQALGTYQAISQAARERELEKANLARHASEARTAARAASRRTEAQAAMVEISTMQRTVALMDHEFARLTLEFVRSRTVNAELWYRLADALRSLSQLTLSRAIEVAFLAEQSFEFETGRRMDVIRMDYDVGELGDYLAADFLSRDLDALEHALIAGEREPRVEATFVVSLARDFPAALEELRANGSCLLALSLALVERRFPGLHHARIVATSAVPIALLDPTRQALAITHLGSSFVRVAAGSSSFAAPDLTSWCSDRDPTLDSAYPVKLQIAAPQTEWFSTLAGSGGALDPIAANQRRLFEGRGLAGTFKVDLDAHENRMDAASLADIIITFQVSGYHDAELAERIRRCLPTTTTETLVLPGAASEPDHLFEFLRTGIMIWKVDQDRLPRGRTAGRARNVGIILSPAQRAPDNGRLRAVYDLDVMVDAAGQVSVAVPAARVSVEIRGRTVAISVAATPPPDGLRVDFGEGHGWEGAPAGTTSRTHTYDKDGPSEIILQIAQAGRLAERRLRLGVADGRDLPGPLEAWPVLSVVSSTPEVVTVALAADGRDAGVVAVGAKVGGRSADPAAITLARGTTTKVRVELVREVAAVLRCGQRYSPPARLVLRNLGATTNRLFDGGADTTPAPNDLSRALFGAGEIGVRDTWELEIGVGENPFLASIDPAGRPIIDLSEVADAVLIAEYDAEER